MRVPPDNEIIAPEFAPELEWLNVAFLRIDKLLGRNAILVEFWDFARVNSLRTLPYLKAWHERYSPLGLRVIGVHTPGYSFGRDRDAVTRAVERLEIPYAVVLDPAGGVWRRYGNKGWPARFLFDRRARLRHVHFGEGEYLDTELAIHEVLLEIDPRSSCQPRSPRSAPRTRRAFCSSPRQRTSCCHGTASGSSSCATGPTGRTSSRRETPARRLRFPSARGQRTPSSRAPTSTRGCTSQTGGWWRRPLAYACTGSSSCRGRRPGRS